MNKEPLLSVVIPCKNEEKHISNTLDALMREKEKYGYILDITYVDNGSTDHSLDIARSYPVNILTTKGTISKVRNSGVAISGGKYLCFLDADIEVCDGWTCAINQFINNNKAEIENIIFGDAYGLPKDAGWIERVWFKSLQYVKSHVNSGNMVMSRALFERLNGFDEKLTTAEDYDLCQRCENIGGKIVIAPELKTIHYGYPRTIRDFYLRERWHGLGMAKYLKTPLRSKPLLFAYATLASPIALFLLYLLSGLTGMLICVILVLLCALLYCMKRIKKFLSLEPFQLCILFSIYVLARTHSLLIILFRENINKNSWKQASTKE